MKKLKNILSWFFLLGGICILFSFSNTRSQQQEFGKLLIEIEQPEQSRFVSNEDISQLFSNLGYSQSSQPVSDIDIQQFETLLKNNSSIQNANVHATINGNIVVNIKERTPIIRIYNQFGESFYIDQYGSLMPLSNKYAARVLIANGAINIPYSTVYQLEDLEHQQHKIFIRKNTSAVQNTSLIEKLNISRSNLPGVGQLTDLYKLASYINQDKFWKAQISQIYINKKGEFEFIPRVGRHNIIFGQTDNMETKFHNLMLFYKKGLNRTGWNRYSTINLKYKNQVVCTKR